MDAPRAALLSIGDELLNGDIADSNAVEIIRELRQAGVRTIGVRVVGDRVGEIAAAFLEAAAGAEVVIATGGLGPTRDDLTREGLAAAAGEELVLDEAALERVRAFFLRVGRAMSDSNRVQAERPRSAVHLDNAVGTAPGLAIDLRGARVFVLPGVPSEMRRMLADSVLPWIRGRFPCEPLVRAKVHAIGLPESVAGERIAEFMGEGKDPAVGITVSGGILSVTAQAVAGPQAAARARVAAVIDEVERRLGTHAFGRDGVALEEALVRDLRARRQRLATAESCTGGLVARLVARVPGASDVFVEGFVTYSNQAKTRRLAVPAALIEAHGAVSAEVARAMAEGARRGALVDLAVSCTGIAGPGGATPGKPVGLVWFGIATAAGGGATSVVFVGDRETIQLRAARTALDLVRRASAGTLELELRAV